ncbi:MAG: hypothetical protein R6V77_05005 [Candidatus Cloacimonadaceae bacterium]
MNGQYIRSLPLDYIAGKCEPYFEQAGIEISDHDKYLRVINTARNYINVLPEIVAQSEVYYKVKELEGKDLEAVKDSSAKQVFGWFIRQLEVLNQTDKEVLSELASRGMAELGIKGKQYYHPLRLALIYQGSGPDIPTLIDILGVEETLNRLRKANEL